MGSDKKIRSNLLISKGAGDATRNLSINQFFCHFLGVYAFFIYGSMIEEFNPYLVWPRLIAAFSVLIVLLLIARDRKEKVSSIVFTICLLLLAFGMVELFCGGDSSPKGALIAQFVILAVTLINAQGYVHQISKIAKNKSATSMSLKMNALIFAKDISSMALGFMMGAGNRMASHTSKLF